MAGLSTAVRLRMLADPLPVGGYRGGQGGKDQLRADLLRQAEGLEIVKQVLFHPREGDDDAAASELRANSFNGFQRGVVDLDVGFGVQDEPACRRAGLAGGRDGTAGRTAGRR